MARVSTYLNFPGTTEEAFNFYKSAFNTEFAGPFHRFKDNPPVPGQPAMSEKDGNMVMHIELPILGGHMLMGSDAPESLGFTVSEGNNVHLNLEPDTRSEADRLFKALSEGGKVEVPLQDMFWGAYFGSVIDRYGIHWMLNCTSKT